MTPRLSALAHGRGNNFLLIRLLAAAFVVLFHSFALTGRWTMEPLWRVAPEMNFGALGVKIFFVISGFLVTQSWLARQSALTFTAARVLRIYPALIAATLFTIALAGASSALPWREFLTDPQTVDYAWRVSLGFEMVYRLPGAFPTNPFPHDVNGSLWTLPIELRMYVALLAAGVLGLLARRMLWLAAMVGLRRALRAAARPVSVVAQRPRRARARAAVRARLARLCVARRAPGVARGCGAVRGALWRGIPADGRAARCSRHSSRTSCWSPRTTRGSSGPPGTAWATIRTASTSIRFPLQQALMQLWPSLEPAGLFAASLPLGIAVAAVSWHALERPALALKSRFDPTRLHDVRTDPA